MTVIRPLHVAVIILGAIEILQWAKANLSDTANLILAIIAVVFVVLDLLIYYNRRGTPAV